MPIGARQNYGQGYFVYRVNAQNWRASSRILETNWHKLDISLIYAGEILGKNYTKSISRYEDILAWRGLSLIKITFLDMEPIRMDLQHITGNR